MTRSRQKVKEVCDRLIKVNPEQIIIDFVQGNVEEVVYDENCTPDDIGSLCYTCENMLIVYNPVFEKDIAYLIELKSALSDWDKDATFVNKTLGLDPNK